MISLKYAEARSNKAPRIEDGMVRRLVSVVLNPRLRSESVRYVWGGMTGTDKSGIWGRRKLLLLLLRTEVYQSQNVQGPELPINKRAPYHLDTETFPVVHIGLGRIVPENPAHIHQEYNTKFWTESFPPVHHNDFLAETSSWIWWLQLLGRIAHRSENHPLGRYQALVCVGPGGIIKKEVNPTTRVRIPSRRNRYRHPAFPPTPRRRRVPVARKALLISAM